MLVFACGEGILKKVRTIEFDAIRSPRLYRFEVVNWGGAKFQHWPGKEILVINAMKSTTKTMMAVLLLTAAPAVAISGLATAAFAEKGGNTSRGKSNENRGNRDALPSRRDAQPNDDLVNRGRRDAGPNGNSVNHGTIASELKGLNAAHASQNGLENSSPNSMPGKLYTYQQAALATAAVQDASKALATLNAMTAKEISEYSGGDYALALGEAQSTYNDALLALGSPDADPVAEADAGPDAEVELALDAMLLELSGWEELTPEALAALKTLLGL